LAYERNAIMTREEAQKLAEFASKPKPKKILYEGLKK
jgi:hypothetical protein